MISMHGWAMAITALPVFGKGVVPVASKFPTPTQCWQDTSHADGTQKGLCTVLRQYIRKHRLPHLFIGAAAKCAGTTIKEYMWDPNPELKLDFINNSEMKRKIRKRNGDLARAMLFSDDGNCPFALTGSHLWTGFGNLLKKECARRTLFLISVRDVHSWLVSSACQICQRYSSCQTSTTVGRFFEELPYEMGSGPLDWLNETQILDPAFHVFLMDYSSVMDVLRCLPHGGIRDHLSPDELARQIYRRNIPTVHLNGNHPCPGSEFFDTYIPSYFQRHKDWLATYLKHLQNCTLASYSAPSSNILR